MSFTKRLGLLASTLLTLGATAQCELAWHGAGAFAGTEAAVLCSTSWDPDGSGPLPVRAVLGGGFRMAGDRSAFGIVAWDPVAASWHAFGNGLITRFAGQVRAVATDANGRLVAAGTLYANGDTTVSAVAVWTGATWTPLQSASGLALTGASALLQASNGDLYACATWLDTNQVQGTGVARWNGTSWTAVGPGHFGTPADSSVLADLCEMPNGDLAVAGRFGSVAGVPMDGVARWDGISWTAVGSGLAIAGRVIHSLDVMPNGDLLAGGDFLTLLGSPADGVAVWNGATWTQLGAGLSASIGTVVRHVAVQPNGDVVACGAFVQSGATAAVSIARWDGVTWNPLANGLGGSFSEICYTTHLLPDGRTLAAGFFSSASGVAVSRMALWNGTSWSAMPTVPTDPGFAGTLMASRFGPGGALAVGGLFRSVGSVAATNVAVRNGSTWSALGSGLDGAVRAITWLSNGDLVAGGSFNNAGGVFADGVARWNGASWSSMGAGLPDVVALCVAPNGDLYAGTSFGLLGAGVQRWNGTTWTPIGFGLPGTAVHALAALPSGDLIASSSSGTVPPAFFLSRYAGGSWSAFGTPLTGLVNTILPLSDSEVVVGGSFAFASGSPADRIAIWKNNAWSAVGGGVGGPVYALAVLPDGDLVAAGRFTSAGGVPANNVARFDGAWSAIGRGCDDAVQTMALGAEELVLGGSFLAAGDFVAFGFASLQPSCPASAIAYGSGCNGVGGPMVLTSDGLPWIGSTYRSTSTGFGPNAFGVWEIGTAQLAVPVSSLLPQGGVGCMQWTLLDVVAELVFPTGSVASGSVFVPASPALIGGVVFNQMAQVEVDLVGGGIVRIATSNALTMTVGVF
ncbi:MAG: hypothetical protein ABL997_08360 [Planctomycetota bacterium]